MPMDTQRRPGKPWKCPLNSASSTACGHVTVYYLLFIRLIFLESNSILVKKGNIEFLKSRFGCIAKFDDEGNMRSHNEIPPIHGPVI
jgi:hypothetical protein